MTKGHNPQDTELASGFTVSDYQRARGSRDREAIAEAIRRRFTERYIEPVSSGKAPKRGFTMMAVACLMIEALESFRQGWETSDRQSKAAFCFFFDTAPPFAVFRGHASEFYTHVRCGILHQAETTGGWRIRRSKSAPLFDPAGPTIHAELFVQALKRFLDDFCDTLKAAAWDSPDWKKVLQKMDAISKHCQP